VAGAELSGLPGRCTDVLHSRFPAGRVGVDPQLRQISGAGFCHILAGIFRCLGYFPASGRNFFAKMPENQKIFLCNGEKMGYNTLGKV